MGALWHGFRVVPPSPCISELLQGVLDPSNVRTLYSLCFFDQRYSQFNADHTPCCWWGMQASRARSLTWQGQAVWARVILHSVGNMLKALKW